MDDKAAARRSHRRNPNRSWAKDSHLPALRSLEHVQLAAVTTIGRASADAAAAFNEASILNAQWTQ